jgi:nitrogen fixation/metabolism regulation signal transduction histidine kinase
MGKNKELVVKISQHIHEINNHLTVVSGKAEKLLMKNDEDIDVKKIVEKSDKISQLIREMGEMVSSIG